MLFILSAGYLWLFTYYMVFGFSTSKHARVVEFYDGPILIHIFMYSIFP
jgi:hypothetical protein